LFIYLFVCLLAGSGELLPSQSIRRRRWRRCRLLTFTLIDFCSRTAGPISTKRGRNHAWGMGIQICSNKGIFLS